MFSLNSRQVVSIPFKRESIYKAFGFQSSSISTKKVSIPFKRESIYKVQNNVVFVYSCDNHRGFNSLQTGKHIQRLAYGIVRDYHTGFNSLQTGKHIQRMRGEVVKVLTRGEEFQFPSNGKAYTKSTYTWLRIEKPVRRSFNSLQTGKHIQRDTDVYLPKHR